MDEESKVVSITGGIGSGKTTVAGIIKEKGFIVLSSDSKAKEFMVQNKELIKLLKQAFGPEVYTLDGEVNSEFLSQKVFGSSESHQKNLYTLNSIVHPFVIEDMILTIEELEDRQEPIIFVESALTFEAGLEEGFDVIVVVDSTEENCISRVKKRSGLTENEIKLRMKNQIHPNRKRELADFVIENNGTLEELKTSVDFILTLVEDL